jgi:hypothetical protein
MRFDVIILSLGRPQSRQVLARHIASDSHISLHEALALVEKPPFLFKQNVSEQERDTITHSLEKMEIQFTVALTDQNIVNKVHTSGSGDFKVEPAMPHSPPTEIIQQLPPRHEHRIEFISQETPAVKSFLSKNRRNISLLCVVLLVCGTAYFIFNERKTSFRIPVLTSTGKSAMHTGSDTALAKPISIDELLQQEPAGKRAVIPAANVLECENYCDSALERQQDTEEAIKFYRFAISFNPYNLKAWQGLILTYRIAEKISDANQMEKKMSTLFGKDLSSIRNIVAPYGVLSEYSIDNIGTCRISYASMIKKRDELEEEAFNLLRALFIQHHYNAIVLYATTSRGCGLLVKVFANNIPSTIATFRATADITIIQ